MSFLSRRPCVDYTIGKLNIFKLWVKDRHTSVTADHISSTSHNIKWHHFEILTTGKSDCRIKETLLIRDLKPALIEKRQWKTFSPLASHIIISCRLQIESVIITLVIVFYLFIGFQSFSRCLNSLRSKRFQSSYCAKVRAEAKKRLKGEGESFMFFCSCPSFLDEPREETLATQANV